MRKSVLIVGLAIVAMIVLVMASVTYVLYNIDEVIRADAEATAKSAFKVDATVAETVMSLKTGEAKLIGLRIPNPPGFSDASAVHAPLITAAVNVAQAASRTINVSEIVIERPHLTLEIAAGKANLIRLSESAAAFARRSADEASGDTTTQLLKVNRITLLEGTMTFRADTLGDKTQDVKLPDTRATEIGGEDGILPGQLVAEIYKLMMTAAERGARRIDAPVIDMKDIFGKPDVPSLGTVNETQQ
jgi:hypothetical protein